MAYIKKEDAINEVLTLRDYSVNNEEKVAFSLVYRKLRELPTADVAEVKHGHWIEDGEYQVCSECGEEHHWDEYRATYCEDCGARMDGGKAE